MQEIKDSLMCIGIDLFLIIILLALILRAIKKQTKWLQSDDEDEQDLKDLFN